MESKTMKPRPQPGIQSVAISLKILETLAESGGEKGVTELARELGSTKARMFRHLQTLADLGYVARDEKTGKSSVGSRLYLLGQMAGDSFDLLQAVRPAMEKLRDATGQTAVFSTILDLQVVIMAIARGTNPVEIGLKLGSTFAPHATAQGKVALAFDEDFGKRAVQEEALPSATPRTITNPDILAADLKTVRRQGWAAAPEETLIGINALAAPVFNHANGLAGALAIVGSIQFIPVQPQQDQVDQVVSASRSASRHLGWRA